MFWKKKCKNCSEEIKDKWNFCSNCGINLKEDSFDDVFKEAGKEFQDANKELKMGFDFPKNWLKTPIKNGVSIRITSGTGMQPKVEVRRMGEHKHIENLPRGRPHIEQHTHEKPMVIPKVTEEPETKIQKVGNRQIININLPNVKEDDVIVKQLEQSIEVRAYAGDKGYFKLIPIPSNAGINKEFKNGVLKIEVIR